MRQWFGLALAIAGLVYLLLPGSPPPHRSVPVLMAAAGVAWGIYSIRGSGAADPVAQNAGNFLRTDAHDADRQPGRDAVASRRSERRDAGRGVRGGDIRSRLCRLVCGAARADRDAAALVQLLVP